MLQRQRKTMMCCKNICFVILVVSIGIGNGEANENMEARMNAMENNIMKITQAIEQIWLKLDSGNNPTDEGLVLTEVIPVSKMNDTDLEIRVLALEFQMENIQEDVSDVEAEVTNVEEEITNIEVEITIINSDINILSQGQLNQDEKIEDVEDVSEGLDRRVTTVEDVSAGLDIRVTTLEDEDGSDESVTEAINQLNSDVQYLNGTVEVLDFRLNVLEEVDVNAEIENLDSRLDALELDGTVAFHVGFTDSYPVIPIGGVAVWDYIFFNLGDGYNSVTGEFVVPPGKAGLYYFNIHFLFDGGELHFINIRHNGESLCMAYEDNRQSGDWGGSACGAVVQLAEGDAVDVYHEYGTDDTPCEGDNFDSTFSGFRIAPA